MHVNVSKALYVHLFMHHESVTGGTPLGPYPAIFRGPAWAKRYPVTGWPGPYPHTARASTVVRQHSSLEVNAAKFVCGNQGSAL